ncbi:MAG: flagellar basal body rod protein FlgB [Granulosicoccus sp.]
MIDDFLSVHADSLRLRSRRTEVLASNIANADTPNYKAKDLVFAEVLQETKLPNSSKGSQLELTNSLHTTNSRHIRTRSTGGFDAQIMYRQPEQASLDGNTVDKDLEQARFAQNTIRYQASLEFINSRVSGLMRTLRSE